MQRDSVWISGLKAVGGALVATLTVRWLAVATLPIPTDFQPLAGPGSVIVLTTLCSVAAVGVYWIVQRVALRPNFAFRWLAAVVLLLSIMPDLWLLTDAAAETFPGATPTAVGVLVLLHVAAAVPIVWFLTAGGDPDQEPQPGPVSGG